MAAFSTDWIEQAGGAPQIIYDSRVANSLIRNVEKLYELENGGGLLMLRPILRQHLRRIPGRGGTRNQVYKHHWKSGFGQWGAQFFGSLLVRMMRDALNANPAKYGPMPVSHAATQAWTSRGVEMVLFMDGY